MLESAFSGDYITTDLWDVFEGDAPVFKEINGKYIVFETKFFETKHEKRKCEVMIIQDDEKWVIDDILVLKEYKTVDIGL